MKSLGIIGYGSFGAFAANALAGSFAIKAYDPRAVVPKPIAATLDEVSDCDYVMLAIPLAAYPAVLSKLTGKLRPTTVLLDVSSVKVKPIQLIQEHLPGQPYIAIHPLFGPESAAKSLAGHIVILCESSASIEHIESFKKFCEKLGLLVQEMSADDHDREMAVVQALTFFVSRALNRYGVHQMKLKTPSFQKILDLAELDSKHTDDLIRTILLGNKHALAIRENFMKEAEKLNQEITLLT